MEFWHMIVKRSRENSPDQSDTSPESQPMRAGISVRKSRFLTSTSLLEQEAPPTFFPRIQTHTHTRVSLFVSLFAFWTLLKPHPFSLWKVPPHINTNSVPLSSPQIGAVAFVLLVSVHLHIFLHGYSPRSCPLVWFPPPRDFMASPLPSQSVV